MTYKEFLTKIEIKEKELADLRRQWIEAKKLHDEVLVFSLEKTGKNVRMDLEILKRTFKAWKIGKGRLKRPNYDETHTKKRRVRAAKIKIAHSNYNHAD